MARITGLDKLNARFRALPKNVQASAVATVEKSGAELVDRMKAAAPVDEGDLRDSITMTKGGETTPPYSQPGGSRAVPLNAVAITAGNSEVRYPHLVEYGTAHAPAQPFFWFSYRLMKGRIKSRITRAARRAIREGKPNA